MTHSSPALVVPLELPQIRWRHIVAVLLVLNLFDCCLTLAWVCSGHATEANEVMATLLRAGPVPFALVKMFLVMGGTHVLHTRRRQTLARMGLSLVTLVYFAVCVDHLHYCAQLAFNS